MAFKTVAAPHVNVNDLEVILAEWLVKPWQRVEPGTPLCVVETTKAVLNVDSVEGGFVYPVAKAGTTVRVGEPLAHIFPTADPAQAGELAGAKPGQGGAVVSKKARELMDKFGLTEKDFPAFTAISSDTVIVKIREIQAAASTGPKKTPAETLAAVKVDASSVVIYGEPNQALLALDCFGEAAAYLDDAYAEPTLSGLPALGSDALEPLAKKGLRRVYVCARDEKSHLAAVEACEKLGLTAISAIHPDASVSRFAKLGKGVFVGALAAVGPDAELGDFSRVLCGASVAHHSRVGRFVSVTDGARLGGNVELGDRVLIGLNSVVNRRIRVGAGSVVVSGAAVADHVPDEHIVRLDSTVVPKPKSGH
jgi:hypothetical protein